MFKTIFGSRSERPAGPLETVRIAVKGMTCDNCAKTISKALLTKAGVKDVSVDRKAAVATVIYDPTLLDLPALHQIILKKGYFPGEVAEEVTG
jgi:Cu+-exporting ATPase